jgi:hypothetical protein
MSSPPAGESSVYEEEFAWIAASREARLGATLTRRPEDSLVGLAFSGGGFYFGDTAVNGLTEEVGTGTQKGTL